MPSTSLRFASRAAHRAWLQDNAALPRGFRAGTTRFEFQPAELPAGAKPARMTLTLLALESPTPDFAAVFTRNALCGAPVHIGRQRLAEPRLGAVIINNKISNVGAPDGIARAERICAATATAIGFAPTEVLPASTGVIGWQLPLEAMLSAVPAAHAALSSASVLPAAEGIMTTDLYPKVRRQVVGDGGIVGIAKGAGMVEPNLATMLVFLLTDIALPRAELRALLGPIADRTFNRISIDSDTSTSDTVVLLSSGQVPATSATRAAFAEALETVCRDLAEDVVRNGEGVHHVIRVSVSGAPNEAVARAIGKGIVNSPLCKTAICGNDPNVGRLGAAVGKQIALVAPGLDISGLRLAMGGHDLYAGGAFRLSPEKERALISHLSEAQLYTSRPTGEGHFAPPVDYPPHEGTVEITVDLGAGSASSVVIGSDLSHEYVSENADYRS
jgi:glutamate N-acetyltransferase/amino-acid N-acetyltransferase